MRIASSMLLCASFMASTTAFMVPQMLPQTSSRVRVNAMKMENFGLPLGESQEENVPGAMLGEANYRKFVASYKPDGMIVGGADYPVIKRVSELKLLSLTAETGLLSRLEELGLTLGDLEKLLPLADELNLLGLAEANKDLILKTLAPIAIEQAPALLPVAVSVLKTPPTAFYGLAAAALAAEAGIIATSGSPIIDILAGIPLVAVAGVGAVTGSILSSGIKIPSAPKSKASSAAPAAAKAGKVKVGVAAKKSPVAIKVASKPKVSAAPKAVKAVGPLPTKPSAATPAAKPAAKAAVKAPAAAKKSSSGVKATAKVAAKVAPAPAAKTPAPAKKPVSSAPLSARPAGSKPSVANIPKAIKK